MSACLAFESSHARNSSSQAALSSYETVLDAPQDSQRHLCAPAVVLPFLRIAAPQHGHFTLFIEPSRPRDLTARFSGSYLRRHRFGQHTFCPSAKRGEQDLRVWETAAHLRRRPFRQHTFCPISLTEAIFSFDALLRQRPEQPRRNQLQQARPECPAMSYRRYQAAQVLPPHLDYRGFLDY